MANGFVFASGGVAGQDDGLTINAGDKSLADLLSVAAAASRSQTRLRLTGMTAKPIEDLMRIAVTGGECVTFVDDRIVPEAKSPPRRGWFFRG